MELCWLTTIHGS
ncbi:early nodulin protein [Glycine max]|uniref:Early nodulin-40 n=1 Tax=Glycine max TaxID=3847 RepID=NO40_SOYBN|nr:early nodulin protein [Glycine max]P55960.1 RecName: Full=Early nodulin-40 [Glycine max]|eukprot:NP_001340765.1 early nodulin protein [Glycine max]